MASGTSATVLQFRLMSTNISNLMQELKDRVLTTLGFDFGVKIRFEKRRVHTANDVSNHEHAEFSFHFLV
jgi:hypothetical protein